MVSIESIEAKWRAFLVSKNAPVESIMVFYGAIWMFFFRPIWPLVISGRINYISLERSRWEEVSRPGPDRA